MKYIITVIILLLIVYAKAQGDFIIIKNGAVFTNIQDFKNNPDFIRVTDSTGKQWTYLKERVKSFSLHYTLNDSSKTEGFITTFADLDKYIPFENPEDRLPKVTAPTKLNLYLPEHASQHLQAAGSFGITSVSMTIGGGLFALIGGLIQTIPLIYVGYGVGSTGFLLLLPTFIHLHQAGRCKEF